MEAIENISGKYPQKRSAVLPVMQLIQAENGGVLDAQAVQAASDAMGLSQNRIYGIATYYSLLTPCRWENTTCKWIPVSPAFYTGRMKLWRT